METPDQGDFNPERESKERMEIAKKSVELAGFTIGDKVFWGRRWSEKGAQKQEIVPQAEELRQFTIVGIDVMPFQGRPIPWLRLLADDVEFGPAGGVMAETVPLFQVILANPIQITESSESDDESWLSDDFSRN